MQRYYVEHCDILCKLVIPQTKTTTMRWKIFLLAILCIPAINAISQEKNKIKFGKVSVEDFKPTAYEVDSTADAVIIADIGYSMISGNSKGWFSLEFKNYRRARIMKKAGYDVADVVIPLYTNGDDEEELRNLKAVTYNLVNGKVVQTKLDVKSSVYKDKINKNLVVRKFTFPNVKEGSIIEFEYRIISDFLFNLQPWQFQGQYPRLWSEYTVNLPEFFYYVTMNQGYQAYHIKDQKSSTDNFMLTDSRSAGASDRYNFTAGVTEFRYVMKDVPALKQEQFTSTLENHIAKIEFQLAEYRYPLTQRNIMGTWNQVCDAMLKDEDFGLSLGRENPWLRDAVEEAIGSATTPVEKARNIYYYVQRNFTCTNYGGKYLQQPLKTVLSKKSGTEAEINLLLVAMLRRAGLSADPVILSTRSHGYAYSLYPLLGKFNYVICQFNDGKSDYYLDASRPRLGFARLGYECYNGHARVIDKRATPLEFSSESLKERKVTSVFLVSTPDGEFSGSIQQVPGYYESYWMRDQIKENGKEKLFTDFEKRMNAKVEMNTVQIDSLNRFEDPISLRYNFSFKNGNEDIIYLNPMLAEGYKENPFKSATRLYPVEMPYVKDETYLMQLQVPDGYVVDELPKQIMVKFNEQEDVVFEYLISESNGYISLRSRLSFKRAFFQPDEYATLREFFNLVVKKHNEQIVFKKKS